MLEGRLWQDDLVALEVGLGGDGEGRGPLEVRKLVCHAGSVCELFLFASSRGVSSRLVSNTAFDATLGLDVRQRLSVSFPLGALEQWIQIVGKKGQGQLGVGRCGQDNKQPPVDKRCAKEWLLGFRRNGFVKQEARFRLSEG